MKKLFYLGAIGFILFEIANVYFIMPMPGSQQMNSIDLAYFLNRWKWAFRVGLLLIAALGAKAAFTGVNGWKKWLPALPVALAVLVAYMTNYEMAADTMFYQPKTLAHATAAESQLDSNRLVLGVAHGGEAMAYPIQYLGYHHQVLDTVGGRPLMVTYCTVCRTGRVYEPMANGHPETFRLVGMDHFNAMFEDATTGTWWRQVSGEAIAGPLKGQQLPEYPSAQLSLAKWKELYPNTLVMLPDPAFQAEYDSLANYESGKRKGKLTRRDTASWQEKSWVVGVELGKASKAYDWNELQKKRLIHDELDGEPIVLAIAKDNNSFVALHRNDANQQFQLNNDTFVSGALQYNFMGKSLQAGVPDLVRARAYQEYWHSWRTFHPFTKK